MAIEKIGLTAKTKEEIVAQKFKNIWEQKVEFETLDRTEATVRGLLEKKMKTFIPGTDIEGVVAELKKSGFIVPEQKKKLEPESEIFLETKYKKIEGGLKVVEDENLKKQIEENKFFESLKEGVFKNEAELEQTYEKSLTLGKNKFEQEETDEYYNQFVKLVKGGEVEIQEDLKSLRELKELFEKNTLQLDKGKAHKIEQAKKVATIVERAIVHSVSNPDIQWYGEDVSIESVSQFDDVKRGVDDVFQVRKEEVDSFLGLGIDVTYRGLLSEQYRQKLFTLLKSIKDGYTTKIKYFKNHQGECMREFSVPKIILFFDTNDVKELVHMVKNVDNPEIIKTYKHSSMKFKMLNQILIQCELFAEFAEQCQNPIFRKYQEIVATIKQLSWKNPEIKKILDARHEDEVSKHMRYLINEFKNDNAIIA